MWECEVYIGIVWKVLKYKGINLVYRFYVGVYNGGIFRLWLILMGNIMVKLMNMFLFVLYWYCVRICINY